MSQWQPRLQLCFCDCSGSQIMLTRRSAMAVLATAGVGTAVFRRALAASAGDLPVSLQMVADAEWVAGITLTELQREAVVNAFKWAREEMDRVRVIELDNSSVPGLRFVPFASPESSPDPRSYESEAAPSAVSHPVLQ